jgi:restriction system protein
MRMSVPDYQSLMLPVLRLTSHEEVRIGDVVDRLADQLCLAPEDRTALLPSGKQTIFSNRVHWAKTYLGKAGLIESTRRGHFKITSRGSDVVQSNPPRIDNAFLEKFDEFRHFKDRSSQIARDSVGTPQSMPDFAGRTETPDEIMRVAHRQIESSLAQELLDRILAAPPDFFERQPSLEHGVRRFSCRRRPRARSKWRWRG